MSANRTELKGVALPFKINPRSGGVAFSSGADKLKQNIKHLLKTNIGERLMQREYGGGVNQLLHENINDGLVQVAKHQIGRALLRYEPRIIPQEISVVEHESELYLRIHYIQAETPGIQSVAIPLSQ